MENKNPFPFSSRAFPDNGSPSAEMEHSPLQPKYVYSVDKETGRKTVVLAGHTNLEEQMQAALPDTLIYNVIDKIQRSGDMSLLGENIGGFIDVTDMPKNLLEAQAVRLQTEHLFASLPAEERSKYNNDVFTFVKSVNDKLKAKAVSARSAAIKQAAAAPAPSEGGADAQ